MLKREYRLPAAIHLSHPKTAKSALLVVKIARSESTVPRLRVIVSKKVDKRAVVRNAIRRMISRTFYELLPTIRESYDIIAIVTRYEDGMLLSLSDDFTNLIKKLEVLS